MAFEKEINVKRNIIGHDGSTNVLCGYKKITGHLHHTVVFWGSIIRLEISAQYHIFIILKLEKWMNSEGQQRSAVKLFPVIDFSETMQEKKFQEPLLTTLGENLVATWKFWLLF